MHIENPQQVGIAYQFKHKWNDDKKKHVEDPKHPQFILAVSADYFNAFSFSANGTTILDVTNFKNGINAYPADQWLDEVKNFVFIGRREMLDNQIHREDGKVVYTGNRNYRQILPYCAICSYLENGEKLYYPYFRTNKVGESKLANKVSVGYGGHIDAPDVKYHENADIDLKSTIIWSATREILKEETKILNEKGESPRMGDIKFDFANQFITQNTDPEILHLGVIMNMVLPLGYRLEAGEDELEVMEPMTAKQLLASEYTLEAWTVAMLEADVAEQNTKLLTNLDKAVELSGDLLDQVKANDKFLEEEAITAQAIATSDEPLSLALGTEQIEDPDERALFINTASDVVAEAMYRTELGLPDETVDTSVSPAVIKPFVPMMVQAHTRPENGSIREVGLPFVQITDDKNHTIVLTKQEETALTMAWKQKLECLRKKGEEQADGTPSGSVLLDGQEMNEASFNEMVTGDPATKPTPDQLTSYLNDNPGDDKTLRSLQVTTHVACEMADLRASANGEAANDRVYPRGMNPAFTPIDEAGSIDSKGGVDIDDLIKDLGIEKEVAQARSELPTDLKLSDIGTFRAVDIYVDSNNKVVGISTSEDKDTDSSDSSDSDSDSD